MATINPTPDITPLEVFGPHVCSLREVATTVSLRFKFVIESNKIQAHLKRTAFSTPQAAQDSPLPPATEFARIGELRPLCSVVMFCPCLSLLTRRPPSGKKKELRFRVPFAQTPQRFHKGSTIAQAYLTTLPGFHTYPCSFPFWEKKKMKNNIFAWIEARRGFSNTVCTRITDPALSIWAIS